MGEQWQEVEGAKMKVRGDVVQEVDSKLFVLSEGNGFHKRFTVQS